MFLVLGLLLSPSAMRASSVVMFGSLFLFLRMRRMHLILFTVTCGPLLYLAFLVISLSGYKYYLVVVDDFSHYSWTFPLRAKSETFPTLLHFFAWVSTQFGLTIKNVQCDNGREFDNSTSHL